MDAPFHFYGNGATVEQIDMEVFVGDALLITLPDLPPRYPIDVSALDPYKERIAQLRRVVFNTGWHHRWRRDERYFVDHPVITAAAAKRLVTWGVRLVAVDFPSVDQPPHPAHLELLGNRVVIVENLTNLDQVTCDQFRLIAAPLALVGRDGSPVRAIAQLPE
jgi:kynurenine formamidase